jgi:hypothetical protein
VGAVNIPSQFQILGHTITVEIIPLDEWEHSDCTAYYAPERDKIYVRAHHTESLMKHAFWHEVMHAMFNLLNRDTLYKREVLVDNLGAVLAQILDTAV